MLGLTLREEFRGRRLKGTAIELSNDQNTGATQIAAKQFLEITYPTHDLLKGIEAVGPSQGRPVVVIGERGLGKSHLMATLFHVVTDPASTGAWLNAWVTTLAEPTVWQRRGTSWLWDEEARNHICKASEAWSLRQFLRAAGHWPDDLPSNDGRTLVVAGLDGSLDLLTPTDAESWLGDVIKPAILSFQDEYEGEAALVFWLPGGGNRIKVQTTSDEVCWLCHAPHGHQIDFGRILWGQANEYPQEILLREGGKPAGLFHLRIT